MIELFLHYTSLLLQQRAYFLKLLLAALKISLFFLLVTIPLSILLSYLLSLEIVAILLYCVVISVIMAIIKNSNHNDPMAAEQGSILFLILAIFSMPDFLSIYTVLYPYIVVLGILFITCISCLFLYQTLTWPVMEHDPEGLALSRTELRDLKVKQERVFLELKPYLDNGFLIHDKKTRIEELRMVLSKNEVVCSVSLSKYDQIIAPDEGILTYKQCLLNDTWLTIAGTTHFFSQESLNEWLANNIANDTAPTHPVNRDMIYAPPSHRITEDGTTTELPTRYRSHLYSFLGDGETPISAELCELAEDLNAELKQQRQSNQSSLNQHSFYQPPPSEEEQAEENSSFSCSIS